MARRSGVEMERTATARGAVLARVAGALAQEAGCIVERWLDRLETKEGRPVDGAQFRLGMRCSRLPCRLPHPRCGKGGEERFEGV